MNPEFTHDAVLLDEAVAALSIDPSGLYVDGTFGRGGHSQRILDQLDESGRLLMIDQDPEAITVAKSRYANDSRVLIWHGLFTEIQAALQAHDLVDGVDGILLDLGVSSPQLDNAERGFSFSKDGILDMRMNPTEGESAAEWLQQAKQAEIADVLWQYGEERQARRIARAIVADRVEIPFVSTLQLAELIARVAPVKGKKEKKKHPATRSFQAIRIHVNQELKVLKDCLAQSSELLRKQGRLVVISFHSLEDRMVKRFMRDHSRPPKLPKGLPIMPDESEKPSFRLIGKAVKAGEKELEKNPRARSAVMRVAEKQI